MIQFETTGSFKRTESFLSKMSGRTLFNNLDKFAKEGVAALAANTPKDSGLAATSWGYEIISSKGSSSIYWTNNDIESGVPVVILLQYGHGTGTGGYVQGRDFINPAMKPIFDKIATDMWRVVTAA